MPYRGAHSLDVVFSQTFGRLQALDIQTGQVRWEWNTGSVGAGQLEARDGRLVHLVDGRLSALDPATGQLLWSKVLPVDLGARPHLQLVADTILFANNGVLDCYAVADGALRWRARSSRFEVMR